jgi:hypothetical protein
MHFSLKPFPPEYNAMPYSLDQVLLENMVFDLGSKVVHTQRQSPQEISLAMAGLPPKAMSKLRWLLEQRNLAASGPHRWHVAAVSSMPDGITTTKTKKPFWAFSRKESL